MNGMETPWRLDHEVVVFDCDGVLLDSNGLKIDAFRQTLELNSFAPELVAAGSIWQSKSFGTSRYRLFAEMLGGRFGEPPEVSLEKLLDDFGRLCAAGYLAVPETPKLRSALSVLSRHSKLYVASGSDEAELRSVFQRRSLAAFFDEIYGSPPSKIDSIHRVKSAFMSAGGNPDARMLFVGDALADLEAAQATGCDFVFMAPYSTVRSVMLERATRDGFPVIENIGQLADAYRAFAVPGDARQNQKGS